MGTIDGRGGNGGASLILTGGALKNSGSILGGNGGSGSVQGGGPSAVCRPFRGRWGLPNLAIFENIVINQRER